jgi:hypothetical protein
MNEGKHMAKTSLFALILFLLMPTEALAQRQCDRVETFQHEVATGPVEIVPAVAGQRIYLCGYMLAQKGTTLDLQLTFGQGSTCATNRQTVTPVFSLPSDLVIVNRIETIGPASEIGVSLCIQTIGPAGARLTGAIYYAQF